MSLATAVHPPTRTDSADGRPSSSCSRSTPARPYQAWERMSYWAMHRYRRQLRARQASGRPHHRGPRRAEQEQCHPLNLQDLVQRNGLKQTWLRQSCLGLWRLAVAFGFPMGMLNDAGTLLSCDAAPRSSPSPSPSCPKPSLRAPSDWSAHGEMCPRRGCRSPAVTPGASNSAIASATLGSVALR